MEPGLEAFVIDQYPRLVASLVLLVGDPAAAEDLAQEAMVRLVPRWQRVRRLESPAGWLHGVALNLARSRWRRLRTARQAEPVLAVAGAVQFDVDEAIALRHELARLPRRQREALVLRHVVGLEPAEAAVALDCTEQAVRNLTHRAAKTLRARLETSDTGVGHDG